MPFQVRQLEPLDHCPSTRVPAPDIDSLILSVLPTVVLCSLEAHEDKVRSVHCYCVLCWDENVQTIKLNICRADLAAHPKNTVAEHTAVTAKKEQMHELCAVNCAPTRALQFTWIGTECHYSQCGRIILPIPNTMARCTVCNLLRHHY